MSTGAERRRHLRLAYRRHRHAGWSGRRTSLARCQQLRRLSRICRLLLLLMLLLLLLLKLLLVLLLLLYEEDASVEAHWVVHR